MTPPALPRHVQWVLRLTRESRVGVEADLQELFAVRHTERGRLYAHWRLYQDVVSLWFTARPSNGPADPRSPLALLGDARVDLTYARRLFARQPGILLLTIIGLSLGLGIATAAFSIMNAAALRGDGVLDPDRAPAVLRTTDRSTWTVWTYDEFLHLRRGATRMAVEAVLTDAASVRTTAAEGEISSGLGFVSGGFFAGTGGRVILGRPLENADEAHAGPPPVVVSFVFWNTRLNRDPDVVGRSIHIGRTVATIVGVAERGFSVPHNRVLWMPLTAYGAVYGAKSGHRTPDAGVQVFGRLLPGVSISEAEAQLSAVAAALPGGRGDRDSPLRVRLDPHAGLGRVGSTETLVLTVSVFLVIGLVLLLACANVSTVLISTAITREREIGVRAALGASRWRLVRQLLTESLALGAVAAPVGLLLAYWAIPVIATMIEAPAGTDLGPDTTVYLFLGAVTLITGIAAGLAPAWHGRGADLVAALKGAGARADRSAPRRFRSVLVMTQAAVCVLLIVLATLFMRAAVRAVTIDVGFQPEGLYAVSPRLGGEAFDRDGAGIKEFWARATAELQAVPGISAITLAELAPFGGLTRAAVTREEPARFLAFNRTRAEYFETLGMRLLAGRVYTQEEIAAGAPVVLVSESLARAYWKDQSPLGQMLPDDIPVQTARPVVIGVVGDAITARLHERNPLAVYEPLAPASEGFARLLIRVRPGAPGVMDQARHRLQSIDPQIDLSVMSIAAEVQHEASRPRMVATLAGIVGLIAIVLCVIGLYGLTASVVGQRTREMGVRIAMGAEPRDLLRLLMWDSLRPVFVGLVIGTTGALLATRIVSGFLFGVSPQDPMAFAGAAAILLGAAACAVVVPTRRAAAVDPIVALRQS